MANEYIRALESSVDTCGCQPVRLESGFRLLFIIEMCFPAQIMDPSRNDCQVLWEALSKLSFHPCGDGWSVRPQLHHSLSLTGTTHELGFLSFTYWEWKNWKTLYLFFLNAESSSQQ